MILIETYNEWLKKRVGDINPDILYEIKVVSKDDDANSAVLQLDLVWYILLQVEDVLQTKLDVALAVLQDDVYMEQFKATQRLPAAKRILTEFLLYNYIFLAGLKQYIDFKILNQPVDFISHALLIIFGPEADSPATQQKRVMIVQLVLDSGFSLDTPEAVDRAAGSGAIRKILLMNSIPGRYILIRRLLAVGFTLFGADPLSNSEIAVILVNDRSNPDCLEIIKQNCVQFAKIKIPVVGDAKNNSNLADYYYWVKEDMASVGFVREVLGIDISP